MDSVDVENTVTSRFKIYPDKGGNKSLDGYLEVENQYYRPDNASNISFHFYLNGITGTHYFKGYVKIDGKTVVSYDARYKIHPEYTVLGGGMINGVKHDEFGLKDIDIEFSLECEGGTIYKHTKHELFSNQKKYPQVVACDNFTDESSPIVTYKVPRPELMNAAYICMSFDGSKDDIPYRQIDLNKTSYQFHFTQAEKETLWAAMTHKASQYIYVYIKSTANGKNFYSSLCRTVTITNAKPTLSPTVVDNNNATIALTGNRNKLIRYMSTAYAVVNPIAQKKSVIVKQKISNGGQTVNGGSGNIYNALGGEFEFYALDSRGYTTTKIVNVETVPYIKLTCNNESYATVEPDNSVKLHIRMSGNYFNSTFGAKNNSLTLWYRYKTTKQDWTAWVSCSGSLAGNKYKYSKDITGFPQNEKITVACCARDALNYDIYSAEIVCSAEPIFDWSDRDFNFNVPVKFSAGASFPGLDTLQSDVSAIKPKVEAISDYIVSSGYDNGWNWRKWNSGKAECWCSRSLSVKYNKAWGNLYEGSAHFGTYNYPFEFTETPICVVTPSYSEERFFLCAGVPSANNIHPSGFIIANPAYTNYNSTVVANYYAIGSWK